MKHGHNTDIDVDGTLAAIYATDMRNRPERYTPEAIAAREPKRAPGLRYTPRPTPAIVTVYFIGPKDGPIKIGMASRLDFRIRDLRLMNAYPLEVWATVEAPASVEREYHRKFAEHRIHGEWFKRVPEIEAEIGQLVNCGKSSPIVMAGGVL